MNLVIESEFEHQGLTCVITFNTLGFRCAYVGVNKNHKLYHVGYSHSCVINNQDTTPENYFDCHGGLTYSDFRNDFPQNELWYFGMDFGHCDDKIDIDTAKKYGFNNIDIDLFDFGGEIRTLEYAIAECKSLAEQLANIV